MRRHKQRQHALALIYMHLLKDQSFDTLSETLNVAARVESFSIKVVNDDVEPVNNIRLGLKSEYTSETFEAKTGKNGVAVFTNVLRGKYTLNELSRDQATSFTQTVFGVKDAELISIDDKDEEVLSLDVNTLKLKITQAMTDQYTIELSQLLDDNLKIEVSVRTFMPYIYLNDDFMNVLYRIEERLDIYETVVNNVLTKGWRFERLGLIEQSILLLACSELEFGDVPKTIVVNEAIELAKEFADEDSYKLINGVIDAL